ncbi:MAG: acetylornithine deacetylase [Alphaproteobacteria bacterium]|nr:MAG: acetylornithine deacetylase [Alphaproteobacteria bacterium]
MAGGKTATIGLLEKLVAFDTTSRNPNMALIRFIEDYLAGHGIVATVQANADGTKANLIATIGPDVPGGVVLSGHTDVVPVDGQTWASDPFSLTERDGKLYGRGSADMKGFIAAALAHVPLFVAAKLTTPIHLAFSYDEEVGCLGVQEMLKFLKPHVPLPRVVVVGEPTRMQVANAHKGQHVFRTHIKGREAHSSRPEDGVNAVAVAAELISFIMEMAEGERLHGPQDPAFDTPYTSFNVGPISGGSIFNIVPGECTFDWEFRPLAETDSEALMQRYQTHLDTVINPRLAARHAGCGAHNERWAYLPPLKATPGSDAEALVLALAEKNTTSVVAFGTEGGHFQSIDFPAVVCGPGDIAQAHKPDEFIEIEQLAQCDRFMRRLAERLSA